MDKNQWKFIAIVWIIGALILTGLGISISIQNDKEIEQLDQDLSFTKSELELKQIEYLELEEKHILLKSELDNHECYEYLGDYKITYYCPACNDPKGSYNTSTGSKAYEGGIAVNPNNIPYGTKLVIPDEPQINTIEYTAIDYCGASQKDSTIIDIFVNTPDKCKCSTYGNKTVEVFTYKH